MKRFAPGPRHLLSAAVFASTIAVLPSSAQESGGMEEPLPSFAEPGIAPDGSEIAFVHGGDVWTVPAEGGDAHLLVAHDAEERRPLYAPDGNRVAFLSDRNGDMDVYVLELGSGRVRRLTWMDGDESLDGWSRDGRWIYFSSASEDVSGMHDVFRLSPDGGTPMAVLADRYESEFFSAAGPDAERLAVSTRGRMALPQWWRNGHAHIDEAEIWTVRLEEAPVYEPLVQNEAKNAWPMWSRDGSSLLFVSDVDGAENLWAVGVDGGEPRALTTFDEGRVLWPSLAPEAGVVAFERDFGIWTLDLASEEAEPVEIELRGASAGPRTEYLSLTEDFSDLALSPDGEKVAFVARGEVFAASAEDGGPAARVTRTPAAESGVTWAGDSRRIAYVSRRDDDPRLVLYDFGSREERALTDPTEDVFAPRFAPEGDRLAYIRDRRELRVLDVATGEERTVAGDILRAGPWSAGGRLAWSGDGRWLAYVVQDGAFSNVHLVSADGSEGARPATFLANGSAGSLAFAPSGDFLTFVTSQRTEDGRVARLDLVPRTPVFREDRFRALFEEEVPPEARSSRRATSSRAAAPGAARPAPPPPPEPVDVDFREIRRRLSLLPVGVDAGAALPDPEGKRLLITASAEGQQNLYLWSLDPLADDPPVARQLTSTAGGKGDAQFSPDGEKVYFLHRGGIRVLDVASGSVEGLQVTAEMEVDREAEQMEVFAEGWAQLRDFFYDGDFHGADWERVRERFAPRIAGAASESELDRLMNLMVGELNASHLGLRRSSPGDAPEPGRLGLRFDRRAYEDDGVFRVTELMHLGPAHVSGEIAVGDYLLAVDGTELDRGTNLNRILVEREGEKVELRVASSPGGAGVRTVAVQPTSTGSEKELLYRDWVEGRRAYVERVSDGRLGYVHMPSMSWGSLMQLYQDLDVLNHEKDGVVVDVRNNNGGFVNVYAIDAFARRSYFTMTPRQGTAAASRVRLGQRVLDAPSVLVTNQHTLSDGEDFTEGFRTLGLGPVVGEPTAGWIIYTGSVGLVDGSSLRMPTIETRGADGEVMELNPRPVDRLVERPAGESYTDRDAQLDEAVRALLERLDAMTDQGDEGGGG